MTWTLGAVLAANVSVVFSLATASWAVIMRNVVVFTAIGLIALRLLSAETLWLPGLTYTISCIMFGYPQGRRGYYWWAVIMTDTATVSQFIVIGTLFLAAVAFYALSPGGAATRVKARVVVPAEPCPATTPRSRRSGLPRCSPPPRPG